MSNYNKASHRASERQARDNQAVSSARQQIRIDAASNNQTVRQNMDSRARKMTGTTGSATLDASQRNQVTKERLQTTTLKGKINSDKSAQKKKK